MQIKVLVDKEGKIIEKRINGKIHMHHLSSAVKTMAVKINNSIGDYRLLVMAILQRTMRIIRNNLLSCNYAI